MYPTDEQLQTIEAWKGTPRELMAYIGNIWEYNQNDWLVRSGRDGLRGKKVYRIRPSTWGWSGNEDIVSSLEGTWFWMLFWHSTRRGGHYEFEISPYWIDRTAPFGFGKIITEENKDDC